MNPLQQLREMFFRGEINRDRYVELVRYHDYITWIGDNQQLFEKAVAKK